MARCSREPIFTANGETATTSPKWWTKEYTLLLAVLAVANVASDWLAFRSLESGQIVVELVTGYCLAQLFLMSFWLALGGLHFAARFVVVTLLTGAGTLAAYSGITSSQNDTLWILAGLGGTIMFGIQAILLPLRWLLGWRADFDRAYHRNTSYGSMQLGLIHLLALTTACAMPFAAIQFFSGQTSTEWGLYSLILGALVLLVSFPVALLVTTARRQWAWGIIAAGVFASSSFVKSVIDIPWGVWVNVAMTATVFLNLGALRLVGLRLFSVKQPATFGADPDLAQLVAGWPTLPDAVRQRIMATVRSADVDVDQAP
ncbi:MAG TPA: hypothetical protein VGX76_08055 [Pirellulales bacterium]|jgi:hypothetical protein|nr:hypothetical protein [Pirellulales bacterium]